MESEDPAIGHDLRKVRKVQDTRNVRIGTHNGIFHCDEVLAVYLLKTLPAFKNAEIVRSRDKTILSNCTIVVDVGDVYNPLEDRYDHHMRDFKETLNSLNPKFKYTTKLSSAGLIYFHFGREVLAILTGFAVETKEMELLFEVIYKYFIQEIDGIDNGIAASDGIQRYTIKSDISSRVQRLNPCWNEEGVDVQERFNIALSLVGKEFEDIVMYYKDAWLPAREVVIEALKDRFKVHSSGEIIFLRNGGCVWTDHLFEEEASQGIEPTIKYIIMKNSEEDYRVRAVPVEPHSFELRLPLPKEWQGRRDTDLCHTSGLTDLVFVHSSGFIGGAKTYEASVKMAEKAINIQK